MHQTSQAENSSPDSRRHSKDGGEHGSELEEDILVYGGWQKKLEGLDLGASPTAHLHHEALQALEHQFSPTIGSNY